MDLLRACATKVAHSCVPVQRIRRRNTLEREPARGITRVKITAICQFGHIGRYEGAFVGAGLAVRVEVHCRARRSQQAQSREREQAAPAPHVPLGRRKFLSAAVCTEHADLRC